MNKFPKLCGEIIILGDPYDYHDQPSIMCQLPINHEPPHISTGNAYGQTNRGRFTVPGYQIKWEESCAFYCPTCETSIEFKRLKKNPAPLECPTCGASMLREDGSFEIHSLKLRS